MSSPDIVVYTDGSSRGNPGPGGYGIVMQKHGTDYIKEFSEGFRKTTNNRMEMMAAIRALESLKRPVQVELYTDSVYVRDGITKWIQGWKARGWKTANKKPVKNVDLWQRLENAMGSHSIDWHWVKGHAGHVDNELVDELARNAIPRK